MFALFAALFVYSLHAVTWFDVAAAWVFFADRTIHTVVQTLTTSVPLRGMAFTTNFVGVMVLMRVSLGSCLSVADEAG